MEAAANQTATEYSRYGSTQDKQVYIYGVWKGDPPHLPAVTVCSGALADGC
ncbi:MAG: hypothetical protein CM15mP120_01020 [Pseudomonadota bacterium]|nr:MAG: hypothetical protein CM15mP120_01020 [Pseudomonadota bacterium]